jgi:hypothetical protein
MSFFQEYCLFCKNSKLHLGQLNVCLNLSHYRWLQKEVSVTLLMTTVYYSSVADGICHNTWLQYSKDSSVPVCICHATNGYSIDLFSVWWYLSQHRWLQKRQLSGCRYLSICHSTDDDSIGEFIVWWYLSHYRWQLSACQYSSQYLWLQRVHCLMAYVTLQEKPPLKGSSESLW